MNEKVICPWCGSEMEYIDVMVIGGNESSEYYYECPECEARSPLANSEEEALNATLRRPTQKPLTLEEAEKVKGSMYFERVIKVTKENEFITVIEPCRIRRKYTEVVSIDTIGENEATFFWVDDYGSMWRCWATKPSDEEREAAKWDD